LNELPEGLPNELQSHFEDHLDTREGKRRLPQGGPQRLCFLEGFFGGRVPSREWLKFEGGVISSL
jgi:hypothetical protein